MFFRRVVISLMVLFGLAGYFAVPAQQAPVVQYTLGACGGEDFTEQHIVIDGDKLTFDYYLTDPGTASKEDVELVFDYKAQPEDADKKTKFIGKTTLEKHQLVLAGIILHGRLIAILSVDGKLGDAFYGRVGKVDDMVSYGQDDYVFCKVLHTIDQDQIPQTLAQWLVETKASTN